MNRHFVAAVLSFLPGVLLGAESRAVTFYKDALPVGREPKGCPGLKVVCVGVDDWETRCHL